MGNSSRPHYKALVRDYGLGPYRCHFCNKPITADLTRHHVDGDKSNNRPGNVVPAHRSCHVLAHYDEPDYAERKARSISSAKKLQWADPKFKQRASLAMKESYARRTLGSARPVSYSGRVMVSNDHVHGHYVFHCYTCSVPGCSHRGGLPTHGPHRGIPQERACTAENAEVTATATKATGCPTTRGRSRSWAWAVHSAACHTERASVCLTRLPTVALGSSSATSVLAVGRSTEYTAASTCTTRRRIGWRVQPAHGPAWSCGD